MSESVGNLLREQRKELPDARDLHRLSQDRVEALYNAHSEEFTTGEQLNSFADLDQRLATELSSLTQRINASRLAELKPEVQSLLEAQKKDAPKTAAELQDVHRQADGIRNPARGVDFARPGVHELH